MKVILQIQKDLKRRLIDGRLSICNTCTVKLCIAAFANDALTSKHSCNPVLKKKNQSMFVLLANTLFQHSKPQNHSNAVIVLLASKNTTIEKLSNLLPVCLTVVFHL